MSGGAIRQLRRREVLVGLATGGAVSIAASWRNGLYATETPELAAARRQAMQRRRRVIYNNDGDDIWTAGADTKERFLAVRHTPLLGTHVDSIFYCTTQSFNRFTHETRVAEVFQAKSGAFSANNLPRFLEQHTDGLRMSSEFAREHGLESFWTLRMNDIHDAWTPEFVSDWKREDPTRVMSSVKQAEGRSDRRRLWSLVDFEHPDVEPRLLAIIQEVLTNYRLDGVELDFLRAPIFFRTAFEGQPVTDVQRGLLTRLMRRIRALVLDESRRQGRPLLLAARIPVTTAICLRIGIDVESWLREKLVDLLSLGGGYVAFDVPVHEMIELGHRHGVPVYPCLSQSGLLYRPPRGDSTRQPVEAWLGAAARLWVDRADGIYAFNLFPGPGTNEDREFARRVLSRMGSLEALHAGTIQYAMSDAAGWLPTHYWALDGETDSGSLPLSLTPNDFTQTYLTVPEDLRGADISVTAELRVDFTGLTAESHPTILFGSANFGPQGAGQQISGVRRYVCQVPLQAVTQGSNRVMVKVAEPSAHLVGAELWITRE